MLRRSVATIALWAVFLAPMSSLWCAYTCAEDDDSAPAIVAAAPSLVSPSFMGGMGATAAADQLALAAHDDCAADVSNAAIRAVVQDRVSHAVSWVASLAAQPSRALFAGAGAGHPFWLATPRGSPPGLRSFSVLRI